MIKLFVSLMLSGLHTKGEADLGAGAQEGYRFYNNYILLRSCMLTGPGPVPVLLVLGVTGITVTTAQAALHTSE